MAVQEYGAAVPVAQKRGAKVFGSVAVTDAEAVEVVAANPARLGLTIRNNGADTVYLGGDDTVTDASPLVLAAGATYVDEISNDAWWAIAGTGDSATLVFVEVSDEGA